MDLLPAVTRLRANTRAIEALAAGVSREQARWRPEESKWSVLEVINHIADEEERDFRLRIELTLNASGEEWPSIDPPRWVQDEAYNERNLEASVARFVAERSKSVQFLETLEHADWSLDYDHPVLGTLQARDLLASWLAHDALHIRQLAGLHYQYVTAMLLPEARVDYAGPW